MLGRDREPVVQLLAELADLPRLLRQSLLPPDAGDGAGDGDQIGRCRQQHLLLERIIPQLGIMLQRGGEEMLTGDEHDDIIGRVGELVPIGLARQAIDMRLHRGAMRGQRDASGIFVVRPERVLIGVQGHLGVDHQRAPAGHLDHGIGAQPAILGIDAEFHEEIGALGEAAAFEHVAQLLLAPAPARLGRVAQAIDQPRGLGLHPLLPRAHLLDQPGEVAIGLAARRLDLLDLILIAFQPFTDRREQRADLLLVLFLGLSEALVGAAQERLLRLAEQLVADFAELLRQLLTRFDQQPHLLFVIGGIGLHCGKFGRYGFVLVPQRIESLGQTIGLARAFAGRRELTLQRCALLPCLVELHRQFVGELCPLAGSGQIADRGIELLLQHLQLCLRCVALLAGIADRLAAEEPTDPEPHDQSNDDKDGDHRVHRELPRKRVERKANLERGGTLGNGAMSSDWRKHCR